MPEYQTAPDVLLSGFADEAAPDKTIDQQCSSMAALGLQYMSIRFVDAGNGIKNVLDLSNEEFELVSKKLDSFELNIASIGSPIGKTKIVDQQDETKNRYVPFDKYLDTEVRMAIAAANKLGTRLIRGFSFYHPKDSDHSIYLGQVVDQLGQIVEQCDASGLTFGLEVEANLIGHTGQILAELHQQIDHPALVLIFDGANLVTQGFSAKQIEEQFKAMLPGLGWMHVKDYLNPETSATTPGQFVDEESLNRFVPVHMGSTGHPAIFRMLKENIQTLKSRMEARGIPGIVVDLEPHLRGGGQFGGYSGPDGMGIALRSLCQMLEEQGIGYNLKSFEQL